MGWDRKEKTQFICTSSWLLLKNQMRFKNLNFFWFMLLTFFHLNTTEIFFPNGLAPPDLPLTQLCTPQFCLAFFWNGFEKKKKKKWKKTLAAAFQSPVVIFSSAMKFKTHKMLLPFPVDVLLLCFDFIFIAIWVKITISCFIALRSWYSAVHLCGGDGSRC